MKGLFVHIPPVLAVLAVILAQETDKTKSRPYEFAFNLGTQHREEKKGTDGTVMGQYGFATADGYYQTFVYATDAEGRFRILNRTRIRITPPPSPKPRASRMDDEAGRQARTPVTTTTTTTERVAIYQFNYTAPQHGRNETGYSDSSKVGDYYWDGPDGYRRIVTYQADDAGGYRPTFKQIKLPVT